ncbi:MAG: PLP-dependent aminotransferase family protein [Chloroflexi bacterium]|nr:MAG: PLP-dependent aminotransferase family protein [Chloroflexota bacterium]
MNARRNLRPVDADVSRLAADLRAQWAKRDIETMASEAARNVSAGNATDWGMTTNIQSELEPIVLGGGIPAPETLPRKALMEAMDRALATEERDDGPLRYGGAYGYEPLRDLLAQRYTRDRGFEVTADWFMLSNGSAGAIDQVCATFIQPGDVVISEAPTFSGTTRTFRGHQAEIVTVSMDDDGMRVDELEPLIQSLQRQGKKIKFIYTISNFHNPMGVTLTLERRVELLKVAAKYGIFVLDDDAYGELYFKGVHHPPALSALSQCEGVISVGTFSKIIATGLRVGWIHATPNVIEQLVRMRFEMGNSPLLHRMLFEFSKDGALDAHINKVRAIYQRKADLIAAGLREFCEPYVSFRRPNGGFFLWVDLLGGLNGGEVQQQAIIEGLVAAAGYGFFPDRVDTGNHIRLAYSWVPEDELREAARRLAIACAKVAEREALPKK